MRHWRRTAAGQAAVEVVAAAPIIVLVCLLGMQALVAGANFVVAGNVAHAGALAGQLGHRPLPAARRAAPGWSTGAVHIEQRGRRLRVQLTPRSIFPGLAPLLKARSESSYVR